MKFIFAFLFCCLVSVRSLAYDVPPLTGPVVDSAHLFKGNTAQIEEALREIYKQQTAQVEVATIPSLNGETIEQVGIQFANKWKIGDARENGQRKDNGIIILIAAQERKIRIEVGSGLEGEIPDAIASRIIHEVMIPYFKKGYPDEGVLKGVLSINQILSGKELQFSDAQETHSAGAYFHLLMLIFFIFVFFIWPLFAGPRRRYYGGGFYIGGGGGGFGGGGSWSGGGGGFSGGGASGSW